MAAQAKVHVVRGAPNASENQLICDADLHWHQNIWMGLLKEPKQKEVLSPDSHERAALFLQTQFCADTGTTFLLLPRPPAPPCSCVPSSPSSLPAAGIGGSLYLLWNSCGGSTRGILEGSRKDRKQFSPIGHNSWGTKQLVKQISLLQCSQATCSTS